MITVTTDYISGKRITSTLGVARGTTIQARNILIDIKAVLRLIPGGEIIEYTELIAQAREVAFERMQQSAKAMGANAIINVRFSSSSVLSGASEILAYGTAVVIEDA